MANHVDASRARTNHGDTPHSDSPHGDIGHADFGAPPHTDHGDGHWDMHSDAPHQDGHVDDTYIDSAHVDLGHNDVHYGDATHLDRHGDLHADLDHQDAHSDSTPPDVPTEPNEFFARLEVGLERHEDRLAGRLAELLRHRPDDPAHIDSHGDHLDYLDHSDTHQPGHSDASPPTTDPTEFFARLEVGLERHEDRLLRRLAELLGRRPT